MSKGVYDYIQRDYRPRKRAAQRELYDVVAKQLPKRPLVVVDLPSMDLQDYNSIERMIDAGLSISNYYAYETNRGVYDVIKGHSYRNSKNRDGRILIRHKNVLVDMADRQNKHNKFHGRGVDLFNLDFCSSMADTYNVFQMIHGISMHMSNPTAVIVTCSLRHSSTVKAEDAIAEAFYHTLPKLYKISVTQDVRRTYADTSPMVSRCFILRRQNVTR